MERNSAQGPRLQADSLNFEVYVSTPMFEFSESTVQLL